MGRLPGFEYQRFDIFDSNSKKRKTHFVERLFIFITILYSLLLLESGLFKNIFVLDIFIFLLNLLKIAFFSYFILLL